MFRLAMMSSAVCAMMLFGAGCSDDHEHDHAHIVQMYYIVIAADKVKSQQICS